MSKSAPDLSGSNLPLGWAIISTCGFQMALSILSVTCSRGWLKLVCSQQLEVITPGEDGMTDADVLVHDEKDVALATMLVRWSRNMPRPGTEWPAIRDYVARMKARPSFATLYEREGLTEWA